MLHAHGGRKTSSNLVKVLYVKVVMALLQLYHGHGVPRCVLLISCLILTTVWHKCDAITIDANLNMNGVKGTISFSQPSPADPTEITVSLTGLDQYPSETFPWHIHNYPFTTQRDDPCGAASVGGHFDPFMASRRPDYSTRCSVTNRSLCEVGDFSGKFGQFNASAKVTVTLTDNSLSLYGVHSIMGRSVVIHRSNGARWVCANIEYPSNVTVAYSPFRANLIGNIFFIEPFSPTDLTSVFVQLSYISGSVNSSMHDWHIHNNSIDGDCVDAGEHYNPRDISTGSTNYSLCSPSNQTACEVGDLAGKSSSLNFINGHSVLFYIDTNLPVRINGLNETILGRSVVIHEKSNPARIACANLLEYSPRIATAKFQEDGVTGQIVFKQLSPFSPTVVRIQLNGLLYRADEYHIHEFPVDETVQGSSKCSFAGGHYNPTNITRNSSSPNTLDAYEIGDLSGKSSQILTGVNSLDYKYTDPYLPLFGTDSIVGRSVVIHGVNDDRWLCANILYDGMETVSIATVISNDTIQGKLVLTQLANDPFSETIIFLDLNFGPPIMSISSASTAVATPTATQSSTGMTETSNVTSLTSIAITSILSTTTTVLTSSVVTSTNLTSTVLVAPTSTQSVMTTTTSVNSSVIAPTTSTMVGNKTTTDQKPSATTSNTAITTSGSTTSTSSGVTLSMTLDMGSGFSLNSSMPTSSPTDKPDDRKKKDVFKRQTPVLYFSVQNGCEPGATVVNPFSASSSCSPTNQLACPIGDLVGKHGPLSLGRNLLTDLNLPLTGPNSIAGKAVAVRIGDVDSPIAGCVSLLSPTMYTSTTATTITSTTTTTTTTTSSASVVAVTTAASSTLPTAVTLAASTTIITSILSTSGTPTVSGTPASQGSGKNSATAIGIACGTVGGIALFFLVALIIYCYVKQRRQRRQSPDFVNRESAKGYEPLQLELTKKSKSKGRKAKRSEEYVEL